MQSFAYPPVALVDFIFEIIFQNKPPNIKEKLYASF
jgi:hypothetical protein